jgi:hypothetical protein
MEAYPILWTLRSDANIQWKLAKFLKADSKIGVQNAQDFKIALSHLRDATKSCISDFVMLPDWFPPPQLKMPLVGFCADYFSHNGLYFCSRRFRDTLAQPENVVQFAPVELIDGGPEVVAQDYRLIRVMAHQPAMDLERSDCSIEYYPAYRTGEPIRIVGEIKRYVLLEGLTPDTEIFRVDEHPTTILVTDAVAQRVLRAGCTGMEFGHIDNPQGLTGIVRYRTIDGIAERRLDAPALPKRKPRDSKKADKTSPKI